MVPWPLYCDPYKGRSKGLSCRKTTKKFVLCLKRHLITIIYQEIVEILNEKRYDRLVLNTICNATQDRQTEAEEIAKQVDAMIVVGGRHSSNTQKLYEICKQECRNTYYIQTLADLDPERFRSRSMYRYYSRGVNPK